MCHRHMMLPCRMRSSFISHSIPCSSYRSWPCFAFRCTRSFNCGSKVRSSRVANEYLFVSCFVYLVCTWYYTSCHRHHRAKFALDRNCKPIKQHRDAERSYRGWHQEHHECITYCWARLSVSHLMIDHHEHSAWCRVMLSCACWQV
jgi:hypothetical protein